MDASRGPARKPPRICCGTTVPQPLVPSGTTGPSGSEDPVPGDRPEVISGGPRMFQAIFPDRADSRMQCR